MLAIPNIYSCPSCSQVFQVPKHSSQGQGKVDWPVVPQVWLLALLIRARSPSDQSDICSLPVLKNNSQLPWPFKDNQERPCNMTNSHSTSGCILPGPRSFCMSHLFKTFLNPIHLHWRQTALIPGPPIAFRTWEYWRVILPVKSSTKRALSNLLFVSLWPLPHSADYLNFPQYLFCSTYTFRSPSCCPSHSSHLTKFIFK